MIITRLVCLILNKFQLYNSYDLLFFTDVEGFNFYEASLWKKVVCKRAINGELFVKKFFREESEEKGQLPHGKGLFGLILNNVANLVAGIHPRHPLFRVFK